MNGLVLCLFVRTAVGRAIGCIIKGEGSMVTFTQNPKYHNTTVPRQCPRRRAGGLRFQPAEMATNWVSLTWPMPSESPFSGPPPSSLKVR